MITRTANDRSFAPLMLRTLASIDEPRYGSSITVQIQFKCGRLFRHATSFRRNPADRARARMLVTKINALGGLTVLHVATSAHWVRTGRMSGCVQVNRVVVTELETLDRVGYDGKPVVRFQMSGPVSRSWGEEPKPGAVWAFGSQYDYSGRTHEEIKADVEKRWTVGIFGCDNLEYWPYVDSEIEAALAAQRVAAA